MFPAERRDKSIGRKVERQLENGIALEEGRVFGDNIGRAKEGHSEFPLTRGIMFDKLQNCSDSRVWFRVDGGMSHRDTQERVAGFVSGKTAL
jgi:hypothetical protein